MSDKQTQTDNQTYHPAMADALGHQALEPQANESQNYKIKVFRAIDLPEEFKPKILANFLNSLRYGNDLFKLIDKDAYFPVYTRYIESLLNRPSGFVTLAMIDDVCIGWCIHEPPQVHYVWVAKQARRQGIGKSLLPKYFESFSHITRVAMSIWPKYENLRFNPFV